MNLPDLKKDIDIAWDRSILPTLLDYIAIPCLSPAFDADWASAGHMDRALDLLTGWAREQLADMPGVSIEALHLPGRTPVLLVDMPGSSAATTLIYGHLDKQPAMEGWTNGRSAWSPRLEGDRLYGRGGADDGYALFAAVAAIKALHGCGMERPRCLILIEASEESGSPDLSAYLALLAPRLETVSLVVALDGSCGNYDQLWTTTSLRGQVAGTLEVRTLESGVHSGDASGVVASSFRIARHLLSRIEDPRTGEVVPAFHVPIPQARRREARDAAGSLGSGLATALPIIAGLHPVHTESSEVVLNRSWRPQLAVTGLDGLPGVAHAAAVMQPATRLKVSLRLPPTLDAEAASQRLKAILEDAPPHACRVGFSVDMVSPGWNAPATPAWLQRSLDNASQQAFGRPSAAIGGGGGIPFLAMLGKQLPNAQFVVTGVQGPLSNAHGPDEFLHLPTARRLTMALALLLHGLE
ncbi:M20/M25/M40 family metallo-hydrolase [Pseudoxanthomonas putridarboris]|uniref:M20/M25/M40 family metallo-hydrolase n=1 Tax=Pseudoxanthomonas putridarboris TaxID=752605 RepID=A0ABU9IWH2_9GAMM